MAHFGLGGLAAVEHVEVRWPDGAVAHIEAPPVRRTIEVPHPARYLSQYEAAAKAEARQHGFGRLHARAKSPQSACFALGQSDLFSY